jgi:predicted SprT family Zn-dependent metalloprotease
MDTKPKYPANLYLQDIFPEITMNIDKAKKLIQELMDEFGISEMGWTFSLNKRINSAGITFFREKRFEISEPVIKINNEKAVADIIKHEFAHILSEQSAHNEIFFKMCEWLDVTPSKLALPHIKQPQKRYVATCPKCGYTYQFQNKTSRIVNAACAKCCTKYNNGEFSDEFIMQIKLNR